MYQRILVPIDGSDTAARGLREAIGLACELKSKLVVARSKLDAAKAAGDDKWDAFKEGVESSWKELESAFKKLTH